LQRNSLSEARCDSFRMMYCICAMTRPAAPFGMISWISTMARGAFSGAFVSQNGQVQHSASPTLTVTRCLPHNLYIEMTALLPIASRVEAAIQAYNSVQEFTNKPDWMKGLRRELVSTHLRGVFTRRFDRHYFEIESCQEKISRALQRGWAPKSSRSSPHFGSAVDSANRERGSRQSHQVPSTTGRAPILRSSS
jgi:hypothetical protein